MNAVGTQAIFTWPRTDGSPSRWPSTGEHTMNPNGTWYESLPRTHPRFVQYEEKVGQWLVENGHVPAEEENSKVTLPRGYALFSHCRRRPDRTVRVDTHLFGSANVNKFRTAAEFFEHAAWLMDEEKPLDDHSQCGCRFNNIAPSFQTQSSKRNGYGSPNRPVKRTKLSAPEDEDDEGPSNGVVPEREIDLASGRRFRRGELVWFRTPTVAPPPTSSTCPHIGHWPGLIASVTPKRSASASAGEPSTATCSEYLVRPLGLYRPTATVRKLGADLLPWLVGHELLGGRTSWKLLNKEATRILRSPLSRGIVQQDPNGVVLSLEQIMENEARFPDWARRKAFEEEDATWEDKVVRLMVALKQATCIADCWALTDNIEVTAESDMSGNERHLVLSGKRTLYQGIWWGSERIWLGDLVRLNLDRSALPSKLGEPKDGAMGCIIFRVRVIAVDLGMRATPDGPPWRCLLYGDMYELVKADSKDLSTGLSSPSIEPDNEIPLYFNPLPPEGYRYHLLNDPETEVTVNLTDIAGRVYPDLLDPNTQTWFGPNSARVGAAATALAGLVPGATLAAKPRTWKEDLYTAVLDATRQVEVAMKRFHAYQLRIALDAATQKSKRNTTHPVSAASKASKPPASVPSKGTSMAARATYAAVVSAGGRAPTLAANGTSRTATMQPPTPRSAPVPTFPPRLGPASVPVVPALRHSMSDPARL